MPHPNKRKKLNLQAQNLRELWLRFVIQNSLPLALIEYPSTRELLLGLDDDADNLLPSSHNTVAADLKRAYFFKRDLIKESLLSVTFSIHLVIDLWTSPNYLSLLGVVAQYNSRDYGLQALMSEELHRIRATNAKITKKRNIKVIYISQRESLTIQEAVELSHQPLEANECSGCRSVEHTARTCPVIKGS